ncbi:MAG: 4-(cytidine 5'-diphospho)-2-C-methyl-D-erythritol kinase [Bacteroidetes bacterium]|nr:4-(cytidine 5'-diphospho)-2-C-methyl-D-erythritol kinase [Bacteroidota bacterium]MBS1648076.1 4-(cytidine 5'-diphospho)-2-C-methyl-D-erythritol kinase [Bacteroidota bacterium]
MVLFPNAKINLGLNIVRKRKDGYHDLETFFYPLNIYDAVEIISEVNDKTQTPPIDSITFHSSGLTVEGSIENNLCVKAYQLLKKDFPLLPSIKMHLHKNIPMGAGLGGGSADGAFVLKLLNQKYHLQLSQQQFINYALQLGSDCPFFIINKPCLATSRGEKMSEINIDLSTYKFLLVNPQIHISTSWAFANIQPTVPIKPIQQIITQPIHTWKEELVNDFEQPVFKKYASIHSLKNEMYKMGAIYAAMSGSGSTVFGIFEKEKKIIPSFPQNYFVQEVAV